jgi:hypothetical protein
LAAAREAGFFFLVAMVLSLSIPVRKVSTVRYL